MILSVCAQLQSNCSGSRYTFFIALYPLGVTGELLCFYWAQAHVQEHKSFSYELPNSFNFTFSYHYLLLFVMFLYIPCKYLKCKTVESLVRGMHQGTQRYLTIKFFSRNWLFFVKICLQLVVTTNLYSKSKSHESAHQAKHLELTLTLT